MDKLPMTLKGYAILQAELQRRVEIERPRLIQRLQEAKADDPDIAFNAAYQAANVEQERNEAAIAELHDKLARAEVIDVSALSGNIVRFGATVVLRDDDSGERKVWQLVGEPEADAHQGKISVTSPIGRALLGKRKGDAVEVQAPGGVKSYEIDEVEWRDLGAAVAEYAAEAGAL
jgi:transcription elongation factor GreA